MRKILRMSFGGLSRAYFLRQLFFGSLFLAGFSTLLLKSQNPDRWSGVLFAAVTTLLYPYARIVYDTVVDFILGDTVIYGELSRMLWWKTLMMGLCWALATVIAPVGLIGLYIYHWRNQRKDVEPS